MQYKIMLRYSAALKSRPCRRANSQLISEAAPMNKRAVPTIPKRFPGKSMVKSNEQHIHNAGNSSE
jgi:hypothetical protein